MADVLGDPETLIAELRRRAQQTALSASESAKKQAEEALRQAEAKCQELNEEADRRAEREVAAVRLRISASGELRARERSLNSREELFERVWEEAENRLRALTASADYAQVLERLALLAARELCEDSLTLASDPAGHVLLTKDRLAEWSKKAGVVFVRAAQPADAWVGLLALNGRLRYDAAFPTRLSEARQFLREKTFRALVGDDD